MTNKYLDVSYHDKNLKIISRDEVKSKAFKEYNKLLDNKDKNSIVLINRCHQ